MLQSNKGKIIFIVIFSIIICATTVGLIKYTQNKLDEKATLDTMSENIVEVKEELKITVKKEESQFAIDLEKTKVYDNPLKIEKYLIYNNNEKFQYLQIDGLKDKTLESKINNEIIGYIKESYDKYKKNNDAYTSVTVEANYSNVLSIQIVICKGINKNDDYETENYYLNYNLKDGKKINILDAFTSEDKCLTALRNAAYTTFAWDYAEQNRSDSESYDMKKVNYQGIEDDVYKTIMRLKAGKIKDFYITSKYIMIIDQNKTFEIKMEDCPDAIAICKRYATDDFKKIYENPSLVTYKHYALTDNYYEYLYTNLIDGENVYASVYIDCDNIPNNIYNIAKKYVDSKLEEINKLNKSSNEFNIISYGISINNDEESKTKYILKVSDMEYSTTKKSWNEEVKKKLIEYWRRTDENVSYFDIIDLDEYENVEPTKREEHEEIYDKNAEVVYLTNDEVQNIGTQKVQDFIDIENIVLEQTEKDESGRYIVWAYDISQRFTDKGFERYLKKSDYIKVEKIKHTDEDGYQYEEENYYLTKREKYQLGNVENYVGFEEIKLIDQDSYSIIITSIIKYIDENGNEDNYNLKLKLDRINNQWYIDDYEITK